VTVVINRLDRHDSSTLLSTEADLHMCHKHASKAPKASHCHIDYHTHPVKTLVTCRRAVQVSRIEIAKPKVLQQIHTAKRDKDSWEFASPGTHWCYSWVNCFPQATKSPFNSWVDWSNSFLFKETTATLSGLTGNWTCPNHLAIVANTCTHIHHTPGIYKVMVCITDHHYICQL